MTTTTHTGGVVDEESHLLRRPSSSGRRRQGNEGHDDDDGENNTVHSFRANMVASFLGGLLVALVLSSSPSASLFGGGGDVTVGERYEQKQEFVLYGQSHSSVQHDKSSRTSSKSSDSSSSSSSKSKYSSFQHLGFQIYTGGAPVEIPGLNGVKVGFVIVIIIILRAGRFKTWLLSLFFPLASLTVLVHVISFFSFSLKPFLLSIKNPECFGLNTHGQAAELSEDDQAANITNTLWQCYLGHHNPVRDVRQRLQIMKDAVEKAHAVATTDEETLKIFIAPEFFFRGIDGAYTFTSNSYTDSDTRDKRKMDRLWKEADGDDYDPECGEVCHVLKGLEELVAHKKYKDWIFLFGTVIVSESLPTEDEFGTYPTR